MCGIPCQKDAPQSVTLRDLDVADGTRSRAEGRCETARQRPLLSFTAEPQGHKDV
jgi:hypothetical protein